MQCRLMQTCIPLISIHLMAGTNPPSPIQDNSFLVEEAYNQERGIIQHIQTFERFKQSGDWLYTFTEEWPVPDETHQLGFTIPYQHAEASPDGSRAIGDAAINYRYQLLGNGDAPVAIAPRFSLLLPTGDEKQFRGNGALGYQINLPISIVLSNALVSHFNVGATYIPGAKAIAGAKADISSWNIGQSLVWLARPTVNAMVEFAYSNGEQVAGLGEKSRVRSCYMNPGFRWAINFDSGLQIVPGISIPIGVGPSNGERAVFVYLSFEHPF